MTYDLRRPRRKGFIRRVPHTQRYELTREGRRLAVFFIKTYTRGSSTHRWPNSTLTSGPTLLSASSNLARIRTRARPANTTAALAA